MATRAVPATRPSDFVLLVREGLTREGQKELPSKFFYDQAGSALFDRICLLPEYGLTRAEERILSRHAAENRLDKLAAAIETGSEDGMINFNQALFNLVKQGKVSEQEALSKASNPQALEMNFKGIFLDEGRRILA